MRILDRFKRINETAAVRFEKRTLARDRLQAARKAPGRASDVEDEGRVVKRLELQGMSARTSRKLATEMFDRNAGSFDEFLERIIDSSELAPTAFLRKGARKSRAVGRIAIIENGVLVGYGTGFRVSRDLVLTNEHVLESWQAAQSSFIEFDFETEDMYAPPNPVKVQFDISKFFYNNAQLDFALVGLRSIDMAGNPLGDRPWIPLVRESGKALIGERVNIIQHPGGRPQEISVRANKVVDRFDNFLHYVTDTQGGSSGSPVLNDQWILAALHHAGVPKKDGLGNHLYDTYGNPVWAANEGVRISSIVAHLEHLRWPAVQERFYNGCFEPYVDVDYFQSANESSKLSAGGQVQRQALAGLESLGLASHCFKLVPCDQKTAAVSGPGDGRNVAPTKPLDTGAGPVSALHTDQLAPANSDALGDAANKIVTNAEQAETDYYSATADKRARDAYYREVDFEARATALYEQLRDLVRDTHSRPMSSYSHARWNWLYPRVDRRLDGELLSVYSNEPFDATELVRAEMEVFAIQRPETRPFLERGDIAAALDSYSNSIDYDIEESFERTPFNCEHVVPQSWFRKKEPMKSDLHHLFTCEPGCNSARSNYPYYDFHFYDTPEERTRHDCGHYEDAPDGRKGFEPQINRGVVARATMYFILRYPGVVGDEYREMPKSRLHVLLNWHKRHPVQLYERHRNAVIQEAQGNRNPFIDFPGLADRVEIDRGFD